ncbi:MAG: nucleoside recognition membrane protein YjiH [Halieaceae bacterium]|jgi:nucleoside recognition membrane protein YjiH
MENRYHNIPTYLKFMLPSALGGLLFLIPFEVDGVTKVLLGVISDWINEAAGVHMRTFCATVFILSALLTPIYTLGPASLRKRFPGVAHVFLAGPFALIMRCAGGLFCGMTLLQLGPEWIIGDATGGTAYFDIAAIIFCLIGTGAMLMPLLTDYGLLEFIGTLLRRFFQKVFGLPGRSTIDALASWVGSSSIAVLVTSRQYEGGFYTAREASVIATNFSVVSVPFVFLIADVAGIDEYGGTLYMAMIFIGVICALITPRLPPLSRMPDEYYAPVGRQIHEEVQAGVSTFAWARDEGLKRAASGPSLWEMLRSGFSTTFDLFFAMMPVAMTIEFLALVTYHHTEILHFLTLPLVPLLNLMAVPEASVAAPGLIIGFLDQFVPAVIAGGISSPITSFVLAGLSVTQLIFMAETGVLIYRSKIPLPISTLAIVFLIRTAIALPLLVAIAHWQVA